jgi:hypothetical protein
MSSKQVPEAARLLSAQCRRPVLTGCMCLRGEVS